MVSVEKNKRVGPESETPVSSIVEMAVGDLRLGYLAYGKRCSHLSHFHSLCQGTGLP